jgi:hypothetical protein
MSRKRFERRIPVFERTGTFPPSLDIVATVIGSLGVYWKLGSPLSVLWESHCLTSTTLIEMNTELMAIEFAFVVQGNERRDVLIAAACLESHLVNVDCMWQSPAWEANSGTATQQITRHLWNTKVHYRVHNSTALHCLSRINPVHGLSFYFSNFDCNIRLIVPSIPRSFFCQVLWPSIVRIPFPPIVLYAPFISPFLIRSS